MCAASAPRARSEADVTRRLTIREDQSLPPGWAAITISAPPAGLAPLLSITRRGYADTPHLGPAGWQSAECLIEASRVRAIDGAQEWLFGPQVTQHLSLEMDVLIKVPGAGIEERHFWPEVSHGAAVAIAPLTTTGAGPAPVPPAPFAARRETAAPGEAAPASGPVGAPMDAPASPEPEASAPSLGPESDHAAAVPHPRGQRAWWRSRRGMLTLTGLAAIVVLCVLFATQMLPLADTTATASFQERYESYSRQGGHADELYTLAREAMGTGEDEIAFKALTLSADRGGAAAALQLARWYDPNAADHGRLRPDAASAAIYYLELSQRGDPAAQDSLRALCRAASDPERSRDEAFASFDFASFCTPEVRR